MRRGHVWRLLAILVSTILLAVGAQLTISRRADLASLLLPLVATAWLVATIHHGYLVIREYRWRRRRRSPAHGRPGHPVPVPASVPKPTAFAGVEIIDAAQRQALPLVPDFQGAMFARGVTVAALPSVAVLVAAVQTTVASTNAHLSVGLSIANVAVMIALIGLVWRSRNPSEPWVRARTRAELLRREQYLCLAGAGPYQNLEPAGAVEMARARAGQITEAAQTRLTGLIALRSDDRGRWQDGVWTSPNRPLDALPQRVLSYLHYRVDRQSAWFEYSEALNRGAERRIAIIIKASLIATVAAIAVQAALLAAGIAEPVPAAAASLLTLVLPPVCAFLLAVQELFSHRRLAASYEHMLDSLRDQRAELDTLAAELAQPSARDDEAATRRFQAAVLHTEHALTEELQRWRILTQRDEYDLSL